MVRPLGPNGGSPSLYRTAGRACQPSRLLSSPSHGRFRLVGAQTDARRPRATWRLAGAGCQQAISRRKSMTLTREENERLTQVGPGTPMGELLRRYWHPVAVARELTDEQPTRFVRILGEDLVLFKDKSGNVGLIQDHCAHRGASLMYGRVEERGISCAYHGWLYDTAGNCLETPAEPADSKFYPTVKVKAYPVKQFNGMHW